MPPPQDTPDPRLEPLLEQRAFVHSLALRLSRDTDQADDLEQEAWLRALTYGPRHDGLLRAWFARLIGNLWRTRAAAASARRFHEERVPARAEPCPPEADLRYSDLRRCLSEGLASLPLQQREVLRLRFEEGLDGREVAHALQVPTNTVYVWQRRALARMRERLEHEYGDRRVWGGALLALAGVRPRLRIPHGAAAAAAVSAVLLLTTSFLALAPRQREPAPQALSGLMMADAAGGIGADRAADALVPIRTPVEAAAEPIPSAHVSSGASLALIARWSDDDEPAQAIELVLEHAGSVQALRTDARGRAQARELEPGTWIVRPTIGSARLVRLDAVRPVTLELRLPRAAPLAGRVVDERGEPIAGAELWSSYPGAPFRGRVVAESDAAGRFRLTEVDPASWIGARRGGQGASSLRLADEWLGSELTLTLLPTAFEPLRGRVTDSRGRPVSGAHVRVHASPALPPLRDSADRLALRLVPEPQRTDASGLFSLTGLPRARCELGVTADGFAPCTLAFTPSSAKLVPGEELRVVLREDGVAGAGEATETTGRSPRSLEGRALDQAGEPLTSWLVEAEREQMGRRDPGSHAVREHDGLLRCLTDGEGAFRVDIEDEDAQARWTLRIHPPGSEGSVRAAHATRAGVAAGEPLLLRSSTPSARVAGRLLGTDGSPLAGQRLFFSSSSLSGILRTTTDATGTFSLTGLAAGEYLVDVLGTSLRKGIARFTLGAAEERDIGALVLPADGSLRIVVQAAGRPVHARLASLRDETPREAHAPGSGPEEPAELAFDRLAPGTYTLTVQAGAGTRSAHRVVVEPGQVERLEVSLANEHAVYVELSVAGGRERVGALRLLVEDTDGTLVRSRTVASRATSERVRFELPEGRFRLRVEAGATLELQAFRVSGEDPLPLELIVELR